MHVRDMYFQTWRMVEQGSPVDTVLFVPNLESVLVENDRVSVKTKSGAEFDVVKDKFSIRLSDAVKEYNGGNASDSNVKESGSSDSPT